MQLNIYRLFIAPTGWIVSNKSSNKGSIRNFMPLVAGFLFLYVSALPLRGQDAAYGRRIVNRMASAGFQGRGYTGNGQEKAARYLGKQFSQLGLIPFDKSYRQYFVFPVNIFPQKPLLQIDGKNLRPGVDFICFPSSPALHGTFYVEAKDSLGNLHARASGQKNKPSLQATVKSTKIKKIVLEQPDGQLLGEIKLVPGKLTWSVATKQSGPAGIELHVADSLFSPEKLRVDISPRMIRYKASNLIGYIPGTARPDSIIMFVAHYDHLGTMGRGVIFPGANDNASGVAMLLNLARYYQIHPPRYTLVFMASAGEEAGILGSLYFCDHPLFDLNRIRFLLNLDLAGTGEEGIMVVNATVFPREFGLLQEINRQKKLLKAIKPRGEACNSDHCAFYRKGVPCFFSYTLGGTTAYHDMFDRPETLPLTAFSPYLELLEDFTLALQGIPLP